MSTLHRYQPAHIFKLVCLQLICCRREVLTINFPFVAAALVQSNRFLDRRIGEYDADMTPEDRMVQRFMKEKKVMMTLPPVCVAPTLTTLLIVCIASQPSREVFGSLHLPFSMQYKVEKASQFSLGEEDLTHYGQSLAEVDDFDQLDVLSDSEEEDKEGECDEKQLPT